MGYQEEYRESIEQPEQFWRRQAEQIAWYEFPQSILSQDEQGFHRWFKGGKLKSMIERAGYPSIASELDENLIQAVMPKIEKRSWDLVAMNN